ncbi:unnamed protein product [Peronospora destructor]|uniref:PX domain-containing protein n=1 Tax=Peronospora destructor TaxID=86335 RepID=A0AAV0VD07_9STRA|nr:unnamed protein product [Peronospora destructor]
MGCKNSKDVMLVHRATSVAMPLRPATPAFHVQSRKLGAPTSGSQTNESTEELPSFVVSDSADLVGSSDGEPVHGMMSAFAFSFIQASETSSTHSSLGDNLFTSVEETSPGPLESLTFAMTSDLIELMVIPEERPGLRHDVKALSSTQQESAALTRSDSGMAEPEKKTSLSMFSLTHVGENSAVSEWTMTESSEFELNTYGISHRSDDSSHSTIDTGRSAALSGFSEGGEYIVTEAGAVVRDKSSAEPASEYSNDDDSIEYQLVDEVAAAIVQEVIDAILSNMTEAPVEKDRQQPQSCGTLVASSSLCVEPSSTNMSSLSMKTQQTENAQLLSFHTPIYAIVDTSMDNGVVMYHMQLIDEVTDNAKWPISLLCRYSSFIEMYSKLKEMKVPAPDKLPKLSRAGVLHFVRGRQSRRTIEERQEQFSNVLRYIAEHRGLYDSAVFQSFLTM